MRNPAVIVICERTAWAFGFFAMLGFLGIAFLHSGYAAIFFGVALGAVLGVMVIRWHFL
jgi:hypothetical protein